jgi:hypothetical protein
MLWLPASACPCDRWKDNRARVAVPSSRFCDQEISPRGAVSGSRLASALILKTAAALNIFLQSIYFALGEREHEVTQLKRPMTLKRTDECADDTSSSYNLAILRILGGVIDLFKLLPAFRIQRRALAGPQGYGLSWQFPQLGVVRVNCYWRWGTSLHTTHRGGTGSFPKNPKRVPETMPKPFRAC